MSDLLGLQVAPVHWDKALIEKYDFKAPRYTSYPTAAQFSGEYNAQSYEKSLESIKNKEDEPLSLYVHIPFCADICYYCACNKVVTRNESAADLYLNYLEKEMKLIHGVIGAKRSVSQLHFGGGTPTFLSDAQLTRLIYNISQSFHLVEDQDREYSIELDPRSVDSGRLALLKGLGFNRISLGVQDFDTNVQWAVNRVNSFEMVDELVGAARDLEFDSINFDLIYGLPKQSVESLTKTLNQVIELSPERIAFYNYAHLPERFSSQRAIDRMQLPSADEKLAMLNLISEKLCEAGYLFIGIDHFVKPDDELAKAQAEGFLQRNFQGYSTQKAQDLIGLGVSSISSGRDFFSQNQKVLENYYRVLDAGKLPVEKGYKVSTDDLRRRSVIMPLISNLQFDKTLWENRFELKFDDFFQSELKQLESMVKDGLIEFEGSHIRILPKGRAMLRSICLVFDAFHNPASQQFSNVI